MIIYKHRHGAKEAMNYLGNRGIPFLFLIDYEMENIIITTDVENSKEIKFNINGITNHETHTPLVKEYYFDAYPMSLDQYKVSYKIVENQIQIGNSFLLNLTHPTQVMTNLSFDEIYDMTSAKYKIHLRNNFVCYSPEIFVQIKDGRISSNPMKGTIDAGVDNASVKILEDEKEIAEHFTIVDLIRNDLSKVAQHVEVEKFRYIDHIQTNDKNLLQVSTKISGQLPEDYSRRIGDIMFDLLPAGSITGAPKKKTVDIIHDAEKLKRGYYTGICGYFDGKDLDSGVMIRLLEKRKEKLYYRSGCGITASSDMNTEYKEMIDKVYLPLAQPSSPPKSTVVNG